MGFDVYHGRKSATKGHCKIGVRSLSDRLGLSVSINHKGGGGQLKINYKTLDQLEEICRLLEAR